MQPLTYQDKKVFSPLDGEMDGIIESFVAVYGEQHRARITEKLSKVHIFHSFAMTKESVEEHSKIFDGLKEQFVNAYKNVNWAQVLFLLSDHYDSEYLAEINALRTIATQYVPLEEITDDFNPGPMTITMDEIVEMLKSPLMEQMSKEYVLLNPDCLTAEKKRDLFSG